MRSSYAAKSFIRRLLAPGCQLARFGHARPAIGAERNRRQTGAIVECGFWEGLPRISRGLRFGDHWRREDDCIAFDLRFCPVPFAIFPRNRELFKLIAFDDQSAVGMIEANLQTSRETLCGLERRALVRNRLTVMLRERAQRQPFPDYFLLARMNVICLTGVYRHCHSGVAHAASRHELSFAHFRPGVFAGLITMVHESGQADDIEWKIALT